MLFGPFIDAVDGRKESDFLFNVGRMIGWSIYAQVQSLRLRNEHQRLDATTSLLQHRFRTALMPITTHIGRAKMQLEKRLFDATLRTVTDQVKAAHGHASSWALCTRDGGASGRHGGTRRSQI